MKSRHFAAAVLLALLFASLSGCTTVRSYSGYVVVKREVRWVTDEASCDYSRCQLAMLTLKHKGQTIIAHCQTWDTRNECGSIEVGKSYDFERSFQFLSTDKPKHMVLGIEVEQVDM